MLMKYGSMMFQDFVLDKLHNLLRFCVHFAKNLANHALFEIILLRGELGRDCRVYNLQHTVRVARAFNWHGGFFKIISIIVKYL